MLPLCLCLCVSMCGRAHVFEQLTAEVVVHDVIVAVGFEAGGAAVAVEARSGVGRRPREHEVVAVETGPQHTARRPRQPEPVKHEANLVPLRLTATQVHVNQNAVSRLALLHPQLIEEKFGVKKFFELKFQNFNFFSKTKVA